MSPDQNNRISELILSNLQELSKKIDNISTRLTKMEAVADSARETSSRLEASIEKNSEDMKVEIKKVETDLQEISGRVKELEQDRAKWQARVAIIMAVVGFIFTMAWAILDQYVFPMVFG